MKMPHPGDLQHRVIIGKSMSVLNENGYPEEVDSVTCTVWAGIEDASGKWFYSADAENAQSGVRFVIRWRSDVEPGMWVEHDGRRYTITEIGEYDFKKRYMQIKAERAEGVV